jgi:GNAT superfamily N-acetyltransferase
LKYNRPGKVMISGIYKHLKYWLSINHLERIKTYGFFTHLRYVFNYNVSGIVVNLQADLSKLPPLKYPPGYSVREMDTTNVKDIAAWIRIVNEAYPDASENENTFHKLLHSHPFLAIEKIFFITGNDRPVGTVTTGRYRKNRNVGGDARLAVLLTEQGKGLGFFAINYAFHYLKSQGINQGETVITLKRKQSIALHIKCGFKLQPDREKVMFDIQKRMWPARLLAKRKVINIYRRYFFKNNNLL